MTTLGHGATGRERQELGVTTEGPALIVTDLCTMKPEAGTKEFEVVSVHPGVTRDQVRDNTGWPIRFAGTVTETPAPDADELTALRTSTRERPGHTGPWQERHEHNTHFA
jgi:glutaconate CoA-transferase subunit B